MKKIIALMMTLLMVLAMCACTTTTDTAADAAAEPVQEAAAEETATEEPAEAPATEETVAEEPAAVEAEPVEITVYAATSMTAALTAAADAYMAENPNVTILLNFGSSGDLQKQIEAGDAADIFISAAQNQMNALSEEGLIDEDSRFDILENKLALAIPAGNPAGITSIEQVCDLLKDGEILLAMGNSDVPCGQYTQKLFEYFGVDEAAVASKLSYGNNVGEVANQVVAGSVDCGFIYHTDAYTYGLEVIEEATAEMVGGQVIYPVSILKGAQNPDACAAFLAFLQSDTAAACFTEVGFTVLSK